MADEAHGRSSKSKPDSPDLKPAPDPQQVLAATPLKCPPADLLRVPVQEAALLCQAVEMTRLARAIANRWYDEPHDSYISTAERLGNLAATLVRALAQLSAARANTAGQGKSIKAVAANTSTAGSPLESNILRHLASTHDSDPHDSDPHDSDPGNHDRGNFDRGNFDRSN